MSHRSFTLQAELQQDAFGDYDETVRQIVRALAGVAALRKTPTRDM